MALIASPVIFAQTGDDRIDNGLAAAIELAKVIGNDDFEGTMGTLVKSVTPYLGMVGPVIGLMFSVLREKKQSPELMFMQEMLAKIERRFDKIDKKLEKVVQEIRWSRVQTQFVFYERKIQYLRHELDKLYKYNAVNKSEIKSLSDAFVNMFESNYENSGQQLYEHIVSGGSLFTSHLLNETIKAPEYDRKKTQKFMLGLTELVLAGSQIEMVYYRYKLKHSFYLHVIEAKWRRQINKMRLVMEEVDRSFEKKSIFLNVAIENAKKILYVSKYKPYYTVVLSIYKKLRDKFYWRNWFVAIYDAVLGGDKHYANTCHGTWTMGYNGFNMLLASNPKSTEHLNIHVAKSIFQNVNLIYRVYKGWWRG